MAGVFILNDRYAVGCDTEDILLARAAIDISRLRKSDTSQRGHVEAMPLAWAAIAQQAGNLPAFSILLVNDL
jgi:hypothetical protein